MRVNHFRELHIYSLATQLRREVYTQSGAWPAVERYALTAQVRRSSRAISSNLAEAWAKRRFARHFVAKLTDALGEVEESMVWLDVASECGYLTDGDHARLTVVSRQIASGLVHMMRRPEKWCGPASLAGEPARPKRI
jgi:four helix bundle protein